MFLFLVSVYSFAFTDPVIGQCGFWLRSWTTIKCTSFRDSLLHNMTLLISCYHSIKWNTVRLFQVATAVQNPSVVGCSRNHAGTQPLNMNVAPSFAEESLMTRRIDCAHVRVGG